MRFGTVVADDHRASGHTWQSEPAQGRSGRAGTVSGRAAASRVKSSTTARTRKRRPRNAPRRVAHRGAMGSSPVADVEQPALLDACRAPSGVRVPVSSRPGARATGPGNRRLAQLHRPPPVRVRIRELLAALPPTFLIPLQVSEHSPTTCQQNPYHLVQRRSGASGIVGSR